MPSKPNPQHVDLLFAAINSQLGVRVTTNDVPNLRKRLYTERKKSASFESLSFVPCPDNPTGELWIIHRPEEFA